MAAEYGIRQAPLCCGYVRQSATKALHGKSDNRARRLKKGFGSLRGDGLTRPPRGFEADEKNIDDIKRKSFFAMAQGKPAPNQKTGFLR